MDLSIFRSLGWLLQGCQNESARDRLRDRLRHNDPRGRSRQSLASPIDWKPEGHGRHRTPQGVYVANRWRHLLIGNF